MKVKEIMSTNPVRIHPEENAAVAARQLARNNIGAMPVCTSDGVLCGVITDRDLVTRCMALENRADVTKVRQIMSRNVVTVTPDTKIASAAALMGHRQIRRLPVVEGGKLCGMVSLSDLANCEEAAFDAVEALATISHNVL